MLILLPPSEGKTAPARGRPVELDGLPFGRVLRPLRERLVDAVDPALRAAPAARADRVYSGVLYGELGFDSLSAAARRRAARRVLIASGLWGLLTPSSRIPAYKLPIDAQVAGVGGLAAAWRPLVAEALAGLDGSRGLVVDCRSGGYASVWRPRSAAHVQVRAFQETADGARKPISHMAKAARGRVARALLEEEPAHAPDDVLAVVRAAGMRADLHPDPTRSPNRWHLDVIERG